MRGPAVWRDRAASRIGPVHVAVGVAYLVGYVFLDWASYIQPFGTFGITPWNPPTGLSFVLLLVCGMGYWPLLFVAPALADVIVRGAPVPLTTEILLCCIIGGGYAAAVTFLRRPELRFDAGLKRARDVAMLVAVAAAASAIVSAAYVSVLASTNLIDLADLSTAALKYWIGDVIGIVIVVPFVLRVARHGTALRIDLETAIQVLTIVGALGLISKVDSIRELHIFYVLFLPVVWVAVRHGLRGATAALVFAQIGLMIAVGASSLATTDLTTYQAMLFVLALTGLAVGAAVDEREHAELDLRRQKDVQARLSRIGAVGELSVSLAHEINQPLAAATTYARLALEELEAADATSARLSITKSFDQIRRASEVVRRLRDFIKHGTSQVRPEPLAELIDQVQMLCASELERSKIELRRNRPAEAERPLVDVDALQIIQVLINLVTNAAEAMERGAVARRVITISTETYGTSHVELSIADTGPGFSAPLRDGPLDRQVGEKSLGLGIGLSLCRSIVAAHGGSMTLNNGTEGAIVRLTLRRANLTT